MPKMLSVAIAAEILQMACIFFPSPIHFKIFYNECVRSRRNYGFCKDFSGEKSLRQLAPAPPALLREGCFYGHCKAQTLGPWEE